jgi:Kef-type K+ transport system membrane component KefB
MLRAAMAFLFAMLIPAAAFAADPGHGGAGPANGSAPPTHETALLRVVLGLALAFGLAALAAHPLVRRIERRLGLTVIVSSGIPFIAMGVIFRLPSVGILTDEVVNDLRPALEFGIGWLGFVVGMQFDVRELDRVHPKVGSVVVAETGIPMAIAAAACATFLAALDPSWSFAGGSFSSFAAFKENVRVVGMHAPFRDALALGACAAQAAPVAAVAIARSSGSSAAKLLAYVTKLDDVAGVVLLGLICAFFRPTDAVAAWKLPHIAWIFVTLGMGGVLGILSYVLVRSAKNSNEEIAYLLGAIALSAGMSGYLAISPLVTCAIAGALLTNLPHKDFDRLRNTMLQVERPLYLIFLVVAGALWDVRAWQGWLLAPVFVSARVGGKLIGAHVAKRIGPEELPDATTLGLALAPQSPIAIATIVSYVTLYKPQSSESSSLGWLMTACIAGAVLTELTVQVFVRMRGGLRFDMRSPSMNSISPETGLSTPPPPVVHMPVPEPLPNIPLETPTGSSAPSAPEALRSLKSVRPTPEEPGGGHS